MTDLSPSFVGCAIAFSGTTGVATFLSLTSDVLPFLVALAVTLPAGISLVGVIVALPFSPATASPILLPSLSNNSTVVPGSAVTSTGVLVLALPVKSVLITGLVGVVATLTVSVKVKVAISEATLTPAPLCL